MKKLLLSILIISLFITGCTNKEKAVDKNVEETSAPIVKEETKENKANQWIRVN